MSPMSEPIFGDRVEIVSHKPLESNRRGAHNIIIVHIRAVVVRGEANAACTFETEHASPSQSARQYYEFMLVVWSVLGLQTGSLG